MSKSFKIDFPVPKLCFLVFVGVVFGSSAFLPCLRAQNDTSAVSVARLGVLMDTSPEMGFLVPQARKEVRLLNDALTGQGRETVVFREMEGAAIGKEASLSVPGSKNALYALKALYEEDDVDTVYWITSLRGMQSGGGFFAVKELLEAEREGRPSRKLVVRNIWQEQLQAGESWMRDPPDPEQDRLDPRSLPGEWYRLVEEERGIILRSWQAPPVKYRDQFGFPWRVRHGTFLRKAEFGGNDAHFDTKWATDLWQRHKMRFLGEKEEWPFQVTGKSWIAGSTFLPFLDSERERTEVLLGQMSMRDSIEDDLARIESEKIGVLFGFGYLKKDLARFRTQEEQFQVRYPGGRYLIDLVRLIREARKNEQEFQEQAKSKPNVDRVYATELIELENTVRRPEGPDPIALRIGKMVRNDSVDAIYLFTNGVTGGGRYGQCTLDLQLLEYAIREAGARLFVRMPFETGPAPLSLERLAKASGGAVFRGKLGDPDWERNQPGPSWPSEEVKVD